MSKKFDQFSRPDYSFNSRRARKVETGSQKRFASQQEDSFDRLNLALNEPGLIALPEVQRQLRKAEAKLNTRENILVQSMLADGITTRAAFEQRVARTGFGLSEAGKSRIWLVMLLSILLIVTLAACGATGTGTPTEIFTPIATSLPTEAPATEAPTQIPTDTPTETPVEINYFDLSPAERTKQSQALVEQANNFSGEVGIPIELNGKTYNFFWNPTISDESYEASAPGAWKVDGSSSDLDKTGETLPQMVIPGYENEDGSLVVVDPVTGQETIYANQNIPALGGVISYRDLYNLPQNKLAEIVTQALIDNPNYNNPEQTQQIFIDLKSQSLYLPVLLYGGQTSVYSNSGTIGGGQYKNYDVKEENFVAFQTPTNNALMPIYSPETGDFMFFINITTGTPRSQFDAFYKADGTVDVSLVSVQDSQAFGLNGLDQFGIITQSRFPQVAHNLGGDLTFMENSPVVGDANVIEKIMNASSEEEIMNILDAYRLLVAYPSIVYRPAR